MYIGHRKEIRKLTFRALSLRNVMLPPTQHHSFFRNLPPLLFSIGPVQGPQLLKSQWTI